MTDTVAESPAISTVYRPTHPVDLGFALLGNKSVKLRQGVYWWTTNAPTGATAVAFRPVDGAIRADAWGPGADWAVSTLPALLGRDDDPADFVSHHPVVADLADRLASIRIGAGHRWYEAVAMTAIGQRVTTADAASSRTRVSWAYGGPAPGDAPTPLFPTPAALLRITDHEFHRVGIERSRARVMRVAAKYADRLDRLADVPAPDARAFLQKLPGVGPWTAGWSAAIAGGDPDAVPVGDLHMPGKVTYALSGEERFRDDDAMLEMLEPYAGHRGRVVRMIKTADVGPPTHRPRPFRSDITDL